MSFGRWTNFETEDGEEKKRDARFELDPSARLLLIADEKKGVEKTLYATIPYDSITKMVYERSSHRRYKSAIFLSIFALFTKGKKHWLSIEFEGVEDLPQNFCHVRLDKDNFRQILTALRAATGVEIEELIEQ